MHKNKKIISCTIICVSILLSEAAHALVPNPGPGMPPWAVAYFHGWMTDNNIGPLLMANDVHFKYGEMNTIEVLHSLDPHGGYLKLLQSIGSNLEAGANLTKRDDPNGQIYEGNIYLMLRWKPHFIWDRYLTNTFAFGDGLSYVSAIPLREMQDSSNGNPKRLLNFLTLEATFAMPSHPEWQLVTRIHHRCGAWGLLGAGNLSSNAVTAGIRYWF